MSELSPLVSDLALILICAGVVTLLFKWMGQPLVLGYIVAGFLASPHMPYVPTIADAVDVHVWADIGVLFLLFALGLEFSFKKLLAAGSTAVIAALTVIACMMTIGIGVGKAFGWEQMDCIYLGGMLAMSSTTIIYKAFDDMGLLQQRFANLVLSVLILEDILAIVLMVILSTMAVSRHFEGGALVGSIAKLVFFLLLWFVVGLYLIPLLLRKVRRWMSNETLLVVALGLCFGMVVLAAKTGFSTAFGAFIMGSILAETVEAEQIEKLVAPVKDLFGAIFFVSVGMMVDPTMIVTYAFPIVVITAAILLGQTILGSCGFLLAGQPLKVAMQCGFSLAQIGEFAFIIASLGVSLGVTSTFLYPIVVAVSVITTFLTPYVIRLAVPAYQRLEPHVPTKWSGLLRGTDRPTPTEAQESIWRKYTSDAIWVVIGIGVVVYALTSFFSLPNDLVIGIAIVCAIAFIFVRHRRQRSSRVEKMIRENLRRKEVRDEFHGKKAPHFAHHLLSHDLHLSYLDLPDHSLWTGQTLRQLNFGQRYGVHIVSIIRATERINIPGGDARLYPGDKIQVIGTDEEFSRFAAAAHAEVSEPEVMDLEHRVMSLKQFVVAADSPFAGKTIVEAAIRDDHRCLVVGIEDEEGQLFSPLPTDTLEAGMVVWIVGEKKDAWKILSLNNNPQKQTES